jgi:cystathionine beta-lyase
LSEVRPEALYLLWIDCRDMGLGGSELDRRLRGAGVWVEQGATYGAEGDGFIRMTIACPRVVLEEALERLERALG